MLLVDSSVWIDVTRGVVTEGSRFVDARDLDEELATTGLICQEVLQGTRDDKTYAKVRDTFLAMLLLQPRGLDTHELAAQLYRRARQAGFTIRKPTDCLIAALALEHDALLVHNDRDFLFLAQVEPALVVFPGRAH